MASQVYLQLAGRLGSIALGKSTTEGTVGELTDEVSALSLGEVWEGKPFHLIRGSYAAGTCVVWVRNIKTNKIKFMACLNKATGVTPEYLDKEYIVEKDDIAEAMTQAVA